MHVCMYVCMFICLHACMYSCVCQCVYICTQPHTQNAAALIHDGAGNTRHFTYKVIYSPIRPTRGIWLPLQSHSPNRATRGIWLPLQSHSPKRAQCDLHALSIFGHCSIFPRLRFYNGDTIAARAKFQSKSIRHFEFH